MGLLGGSGYLVREFPSRVHVFQPLVVPRSLGIRGRPLHLVLGSHAYRAHILAMGVFRVDRRTRDGRLLSECGFAFVSTPGITGPFLERRVRRGVESDQSHISEQRDFRRGGTRRVSSNVDRQENHLWKLSKFGLHGALVLEFAGFAQGMFLGRARLVQLDSRCGTCGCRNDFAPPARSNSGTVLNQQLRGIPLCDWMLPGLARSCLIWEPIFRFADGAVRFGTFLVFRLACARLE